MHAWSYSINLAISACSVCNVLKKFTYSLTYKNRKIRHGSYKNAALDFDTSSHTVFHARIMDFIRSTDKRFDVIIHQIIFISILLVHFLLPWASWRNGVRVASFKNSWTSYQVKHVRVVGYPVEFTRHSRLTWTVCIVSWISSILFVLAECYLQEDLLLWHTLAYYHIIATLNCFCGLW